MIQYYIGLLTHHLSFSSEAQGNASTYCWLVEVVKEVKHYSSLCLTSLYRSILYNLQQINKRYSLTAKSQV